MFALLQQEFVRNAFIAGTIVALITAIIGYFVVLRTHAFASDSLALPLLFACMAFCQLLYHFCFLCVNNGMSCKGQRERASDPQSQNPFVAQWR